MRQLLLVMAMISVVTACSKKDSGDDPYLWLEDVQGEEALQWVEEQNKSSVSYLENLPTYNALYERNLEIYNSDERFATPSLLGDFVYNYWKDDTHVRGIWRRTSLDEYVSGEAAWDIVLDLDALAEAEGEDWVWKGANCLRPEYERCLLNLSRGGADATVVREFNTESREFIDDGFYLAEAKSSVSWIDADSLFVGTDYGDGSLTDSGYPRTARLWARGTPLEEAREVFAGQQTDVGAYVFRVWDKANHYDVAYRMPNIFNAVAYLYSDDGEHQKIDIPEDAQLQGIVNGQMILQLKTDWQPEDINYAQGTLMSIDFNAFMTGGRDFNVIFVPDDASAIVRGGVASTRDYVIVNILQDVASSLMRFEFVDGAWQKLDIETETLGKISLVSSSDDSNVFFFNYEGFLKPDTLYVGNDGGASVAELFAMPEFFDSSGMAVEQHFATSKDGTQIPYFMVLPRDFEKSGDAPTFMWGYGGYEISQAPNYSATVGHAWLARGGVYVMTNIRGGGEYGPRWHQTAQKQHKQRSYDDMIAIAEDLIARGITTPRHLGVGGGSNGGLLTGVMLTQRPDLWNAVLVAVPLLDMKRYHKLLAGASWMAEYGDPDTGDWEYIKEYSPYHNLDSDVDYPKAFFTTSTRDDRVHPGHARKMVARMDEMGHDLLYYENTVGGHAGASDNIQSARLQAMIYSYLWDQLGN